jgi:hypothetical protein
MELECERFYSQMCKDRSNKIRECFSSKCCGICYKRFDECEGLCLILKDKNLIGIKIITKGE